ncbi:hypothetical protein ACA910_013147 [Epithemia clementina (nom. ined.)]
MASVSTKRLALADMAAWYGRSRMWMSAVRTGHPSRVSTRIVGPVVTMIPQQQSNFSTLRLFDQNHHVQSSTAVRAKNALYAVQYRSKLTAKQKKAERAAKKAAKEAAAAGDGDDTQGTAVAAGIDASDDQNSGTDDDYEEEEEEEEEEGMLPDMDKVKKRVNKIVDIFADSLKKIRGAEPAPELFDDVMVEAYGTHVALKTVAQVVISSPTLAYANCFDPAMAKDVETAIRNKLEMNPAVEEGGVVRIPLPRPSMETRKAATKLLGKKTEGYRQKVRKIRRKHMDKIKQGMAGRLEHVSKDEASRANTELEKITDDAMKKINELAEKKHEKIMSF